MLIFYYNLKLTNLLSTEHLIISDIMNFSISIFFMYILRIVSL